MPLSLSLRRALNWTLLVLSGGVGLFAVWLGQLTFFLGSLLRRASWNRYPLRIRVHGSRVRPNLRRHGLGPSVCAGRRAVQQAPVPELWGRMRHRVGLHRRWQVLVAGNGFRLAGTGSMLRPERKSLGTDATNLLRLALHNCSFR